MAAEGSDEWVKIMADDFTATVSKRILLAQADSHLAQLVEYALQRNPSSPAVRLDTSAAVAAEVVAALWQGPAYALPAGDRRLLAAVKHQLDYLGLQLQPAAGEQHYLVVPTYDLATNLQDLRRPEKYGLLMYSSAARGWANRAGPDDPRPNFLKQEAQHEFPADLTCLAGVIRAEYTGIGEDVIYFVNGGVYAIGEAAGLTATGKVLDCRPPPAEFAVICDAAMAAAKSHLYMLGGESLTGQWATTPLRKYDPSIDTWFESDPPSSIERLTNSALVSNRHEMRACCCQLEATAHPLQTTNEADRNRPMSDRIAMLDIASGRWTNNPSGCRWPGAALTGPRYPVGGLRPSLSAAAYDEYSVMVVAGVKGQQARVDVLDLRTWRWREGIAQLQRPGKDSRGVSVVAFEGKVVAVGGQAAGTVGDEDEEADDAQQQQQQQQGEEEEQESAYTQTGVREVWSYNPAVNSWSSDGIARMPFGISRASPVVARVSA